MIAELGLRFRPVSLADQEAHAAQVALLTRDLAGADPVKLAKAADIWVKSERWMPKAADLLALMRRTSSGSEREQRLAQIVRDSNSSLIARGRTDIHWVLRHGELTLESTAH